MRQPILFETAFGSFLRVGREKEFDVGVRENDRADIAAVEHGATLAEGALAHDHCAAHAGNRRHDRRHRGHFFAADLFSHVVTVEQHLQGIGIAREIDVTASGECDDGLFVLRIDAVIDHCQRDGAIHRAGVEVKQVQFARQHSTES